MNFKPERKPPRLTLSDEQLADATYTAAEVKVLTEAALRLGRKEACEEAIERLSELAQRIAPGNPHPTLGRDTVVRYLQDIGSRPAPDASSARTDLSVDTDLPQDPQVVREPFFRNDEGIKRPATEVTLSGRVWEGGEMLGWVAQEDGVWAAWKLDGETNGTTTFWSDDHATRDEALQALRDASKGGS